MCLPRKCRWSSCHCSCKHQLSLFCILGEVLPWRQVENAEWRVPVKSAKKRGLCGKTCKVKSFYRSLPNFVMEVEVEKSQIHPFWRKLLSSFFKNRVCHNSYFLRCLKIIWYQPRIGILIGCYLSVWEGATVYKYRCSVPKLVTSLEGREPLTNSTHIWCCVWDSNPGHTEGKRELSPLRNPGFLVLCAIPGFR